jgi:drug/metabolite transporter (DMT)-like permease
LPLPHQERGIQSAEAISESAPAIALAAAVGVIFIANFFIYSKSAFHNGLGISVAAMRISLILPVLLSTLWYLDLLTTGQWAGVLLVFVTLYLLLPNKRKMLKEPFSAAWLLVLLFLGTGFGDASLKIYEEDFSSYLNKEQFMGYVFLTAFLIGLTVAILRKGWTLKRSEIVLGVAIGIPNLYSAIFLIEALERMNGAVVYSSVNILTVVGATILGIMRWGDRLSRLQWTGIALTVISILLLI